MPSQRLFRLAGVLVVILLLVGGFPLIPVRAQSGTAVEIINIVNMLRATRGLAPYQMDAGIMAFAQEHSEYQASIHTSTHVHKDGKLPQDHGLDENVANGDIGMLTPEFAVYQIWQDAIHMKTMVGYSSGRVGVGVARDNKTEYYTLDVRPAGVGVPTGVRKGTPGSGTPTKLIPLAPLVTMTQRANGCTVHVVGYGQSLWAIAIAYGVKIDDIRGLNNFPAGSTDIYAGEWLAIRCVPLPPTLVVSITPSPTTATPSATFIQVTDTLVSATSTEVQISNSPAALPTPAGADHSEPPMGLVAGLLILVGGTLLVVLAFSTIRGRASGA